MITLSEMMIPVFKLHYVNFLYIFLYILTIIVIRSALVVTVIKINKILVNFNKKQLLTNTRNIVPYRLKRTVQI